MPKVNVNYRKCLWKRIHRDEQQINRCGHGICMENAKIGMMDANLAARIMYDDADMETQKEKAAEYEKIQSSAKSAARRGYVDAIITPADTRKYVIGAFEMLFTREEDRPNKKHGTVLVR